MTAEARTIISKKAAPMQPVVEQRWNRANRAILLLAVALLMSSIAQLVYRLTLPTDGWSWTAGAIGTATEDTITYDTNLLGQPSPLQQGDFVLAVAGYPYAELMTNAQALRPPLIHDWHAGTTVPYRVQRGGATVALDVPLYHWHVWDIVQLVFQKSELFVHLLSAAISLFVFWKRPHDFAARLLFLLNAIGLTNDISTIVYWGLPEIINPPAFLLAILFSNWIFGALLTPTVLLLALTFPQPKQFVLHHWVLVIALVYGMLPLLLLLFGLQPFLGWGWSATCGLLSLLSVGHTLFTARDPVSRAQLRWAGLGFACVAFSILLEATNGFKFYPESAQRLIPLLSRFLELAFPITLAVAILRYRLFDIDLILSRALVYGTLTLCVVGLYIGMVAYLGALFRSENNLILSLIATGVVAVMFQPLRAWLQRRVNRLLFGQRNEPYAVMTTLGRQLETALAPNAVFTAIVETIGQTLKLPYVAITTADEAHCHAVFAHSSGVVAPAQLLRLPLSYHNQPVGVLLVAPRTGEARFTDVDHKLLGDLARQTGIAVYAARVTADVQRSRERIVLAREEERRRLRRDLHDGLGPQLASQTLTLDVIAKLLRSDTDQAAVLLLAVREQMQQAVGDIRDVIYGLRPPVLDDLGLHGAIEEWTDRVRQQHATLQFVVHLPTIHTSLPAALEVAVYRIVQEAVNNVVRHAQATICEVRLTLIDASTTQEAPEETHLVLEVIDNGIGMAANRPPGIGLHSMRERSEELGGYLVVEVGASGGTCIRAVLPIANTGQADDHYHSDR